MKCSVYVRVDAFVVGERKHVGEIRHVTAPHHRLTTQVRTQTNCGSVIELKLLSVTKLASPEQEHAAGCLK